MAEQSRTEQRPAAPRQFPEWKQFYRDQSVEGMPWYYGPLDPDLEAALERHGVTSGEALDIGTGPGTQAIELARRGYRVTAVDLAEAAVEQAAIKAREQGLSVDFRKDDILDTKLTGPFALVFDRGCFHVLPVDARAGYARTVAGLLAPGGYLFLKTFSALQFGEHGPHRFSPDDIRAIFGAVFEVVSIEETVYQGTLDPFPLALFSVLKKA